MNRQVAWGIALVLFLIMALGAIGLAFQPVELHRVSAFPELYPDEFYSEKALKIDGLGLRGEAWAEYPQYNIGLGVIAVISFSGALFSAKNMAMQT